MGAEKDFEVDARSIPLLSWRPNAGDLETADAEEAWVREIEDNPPRFAGFGNTSDCTPGYYNNEGRMVPGFTGFFYS